METYKGNRTIQYAVFTSSDSYGGKVKVESGDDTFCKGRMTIMYAAYFSSEEGAKDDDFEPYINQAINLNVKVFLVALSPKQTGQFLQQAHRFGLSKEGSQVFILSKSLTSLSC